ncbi:B-cell receptor CD22-like isoform X2 [Anabas testudineus]|nr:B-cell receptor CD22-like isoform X2 [Anabas testudineus]
MCLNRCSLPDRFTYIWYKNGQKIQGQTSNTYSGYFVDTDRVSCAVRGQELFPSPSVSFTWGVTYTSTKICGSKGSTVVIHCSYRYPSRVNNVNTRVTDRFWFVKTKYNEPLDLKEDSDYSGRVEDQCNGNSCTLTIRDLRETDSAEYKFRFITNHESGRYTGSPGVMLSVSDPQLQVDVRKSTVNQFSTWTELTCRSNCQLSDPHSYIWYKNGEKVERERKEYYILDGFDPSNKYYCSIEVSGHERFRSPPVYAPNLPLVSVLPSGQIKKGSSVTMSCSSDAKPAAKYTWYKKNGTDEPRLVDQERLSFSSIQSSDSGDYYCTAENELGRTGSEIISIDVKYPPHPPSVSVSPSEIVEGSSVTLTCSSDANPAAKYTWYKGNRQHVHGRGTYIFTSISSKNRGKYYCEAKNQYGVINSTSLFINVQYRPNLPSVSVSPSEIVEGSSVTLTCSSDSNPAANYTWYKGNRQLIDGQEGNFTFTSISSNDTGTYYCEAGNYYGVINSTSIVIDVRYRPNLPSVLVSPSEIVEGSSVTLTCSSDANPAANYTWYKENEESPKASGQIFTITDIRSEHSGNYYCEVQNSVGRHNNTLHLTVVAGTFFS